MASGTANSAYHSTLTASTVDTVTLDRNYRTVTVFNRGTGDIFLRTDGVAPTVDGNDCLVVPSNTSLIVPNRGLSNEAALGVSANTSVQLISSGTPAYSVVGN